MCYRGVLEVVRVRESVCWVRVCRPKSVELGCKWRDLLVGERKRKTEATKR